MKKKLLILMMSCTVVAAAAAGCGSMKEEEPETGPQSVWEAIPGSENSQSEAGEGGSVSSEADHSAEENSVGALYTGTWVDEIAGRAYMVIRESSDNANTYDVEINWSSSAAETNVWRINAVIDEKNGNLVYENGTYQRILFDENGDSEVLEEKQTNGFFIYAEGGVHWSDSAEHSDSLDDFTTFVREEDFLGGAAVTAGTSAAAERQDGERFEGVVTVEGMEEPVYYEYIVNDTIGIGMGYDYELFERRSQADRECFVSVYDNSDPPEIYLEVTRSKEDAETTAAAVIDSLSADYNVNRESAALEGAGTCIKLNADVDKTGMMTMDYLHMIYIIPDGDECIVAWGHYTMESADGFGARFRGMINTIGVRYH